MNYGYGCANELPKNDKRRKKYVKQRKKRGFDDTETWSLSCSFARFAIPRLKRFKKLNNGYPPDLTEKQWDRLLDEMIDGFKEVLKEDMAKDYDRLKITRGLEAFSKYYMALWW